VDAGFEPKAVETFALASKSSNHSALSHPPWPYLIQKGYRYISSKIKDREKGEFWYQ
jgi:hypothetical protein